MCDDEKTRFERLDADKYENFYFWQGFCDNVTNKRLLKKNNGSLKGVVMDLLTGDKKEA